MSVLKVAGAALLATCPLNRALPQIVYCRVLQHPSELLAVSLPARPLGLIFEEDASGRVVVFDIIKGSIAYQRCQAYPTRHLPH